MKPQRYLPPNLVYNLTIYLNKTIGRRYKIGSFDTNDAGMNRLTYEFKNENDMVKLKFFQEELEEVLQLRYLDDPMYIRPGERGFYFDLKNRLLVLRI